MSKGDRGAIFAVGLVAGIAIAFFFFVWAFPWFSSPTQSASYCEPDDSHCAEQYQNPGDPHFWVRPFHGWLFAEDSLAQWLMAGFGVLATGVSLWAVILVRDTLNANTAAVEQAKEANRISEMNFINDSRPWIDFKIVLDQPPELTATHGIVFWVWVDITNCGRTPAHGVDFKAYIWPSNGVIKIIQVGSHDDIFDRHDENAHMHEGDVVFPNQTVRRRTFINIHEAEWTSAATQFGRPISYKVDISGRARVYYQYAGVRAYTEKDLMIGEIIDENGSIGPFDHPLRRIPVEKIAVIQNLRGRAT